MNMKTTAGPAVLILHHRTYAGEGRSVETLGASSAAWVGRSLTNIMVYNPSDPPEHQNIHTGNI